MKTLLRSVLLSIIVFLLLPLGVVNAIPAPDQLFYGAVTLDGLPAPDGTSVTAEMAPYGQVASTTTPDTVLGSYFMAVPGEVADAGKTISFFVNGLSAGSSTFDPGEFTELNLSATSPPTQYTLTINSNPPAGGTTTGTGVYNEGVDAPITATPAGGWQFVNWTGDVGTVDDTSSASTTIVMNGNYTITANFSQLPTYILTMAVTGNGSTTPPVGGSTHVEGTVVPITATPDVAWQFDSWSGDVGTVANVNSASTTITMNGDYTITANFSPTGDIILTMAVNGNGSTSPAVGIHTYAQGTVVSITAIPDAGWKFDSWTGDVADANSASTTVTMDADKTVTANFSPIVNYTLTIGVSGSGSTTPAVGDYTYEEGTVVPITATPDADWRFVSWTGDVADPGSASTTVTVDADKTVTANFSPIGYMTLTMVVDGNGTTTPAVGVYSYEEGTVVPITATPDAGWQFDSWSGDVADPSSASTTVTMDTDKTVTANFSEIPIVDTIPPVISRVSASNVTKTGADIGWTTDEPGDSQVDYSASPGDLTPLDGALVTEHLVHLTDLTPATTYRYKIMSRDGAGNLTVSDEYTFTTLGAPATFTFSDWDVSLAEVDAGSEAAISFLVTNSGDLDGSSEIVFTVNGVVEATREVTLGAGAGEEVTFSTTKSVVGTYLVSVDGISFSFMVTEALPPAGVINWWLIVGIIVGVLLLLALLVLLARKGRLPARLLPIILFASKEDRDTREIARAAREATAEARKAREAEARAMKEAAKARQEASKAGEAEAKAKNEVREAKERAQIEAREANRARGAEAKAIKEAVVAREIARREAGKAGEPEEAIERVQREMEEVDKARWQPVSELEDVEGRKAGLMLKVTALAAAKMKEAIRDKATDPEAGFRLVPSPSRPNQLKLVLDREKEGDQVVESDGVKILLLDPEVAPMLEGMVIDYQETPQGGGFTITKIASE